MFLTFSKRISVWLLVCLVLLLGGATTITNIVPVVAASSYLEPCEAPPADLAGASTWIYPLGLSSSDLTQPLTLLSTVNPGIPHNGEDYGNHAAGTPVTAVSDGWVACTYVSTEEKDLGHAVFVESNLPDGSHVTTLYGHLSGDGLITKGKKVTRGETVIGKLGTFEENGNWPVHLHVGIRDGYIAGWEQSWVHQCWGYLFKQSSSRPGCPAEPAQEFDHWHGLSNFIAHYSGSGVSNPSSSGSQTWRSLSEKSTGILAGWWTFGTCDERRIKVYLDGDLIFYTSAEDTKDLGGSPSHSATIWKWPSDHKYQIELFDTSNAPAVEISWAFAPFGPLQPVRPACASDVVSSSNPTPIAQIKPTLTTLPTVPPVSTAIAPPSVVNASGTSSIPPSLASPSNNSSWPQSTEITLTWNPTANMSKYTVELWGGPYQLMKPCEKQAGTSCHIGQMWPGTMQWHVKAIDANGQEGEWSETWLFNIDEVSAVKETAILNTPTAQAMSPLSWSESESISLGNYDGVDWYGGVDQNETLRILWEGWGNSSSPLFYSEKSSGKKWSSAETTGVSPISFAAAIGSDGSLHALEEGFPGEYYYSNSGNGWKFSKISSEDGAYPGVSIDPNGTLYGVWNCGAKTVCAGVKEIGSNWSIHQIQGFSTYVSNGPLIVGDRFGGIHVITYGGKEYYGYISPDGVATTMEMPDIYLTSLVVDDQGTLHGVDNKGRYYVKPYQASWSDPIEIAPALAIWNIGMGGNGKIYVVATQGNGDTKQSFFTEWDATSGNWLPLVAIPNISKNFNSVKIFVGRNGVIHIAWLTNEDGNWKLFQTNQQ